MSEEYPVDALDADEISEESEEIDEFLTDISVEELSFIDKLENVVEEKEVKGKKKKRKPADPFVIFCKKYLSSLIARTSKYAIFNLDKEHKNKVVFMSSKMKLTFGDYLLQFSPGDLAIHVIEFKGDLLSVFLERLQIPTDKLMLLNIAALRNAINSSSKYKGEDKEALLFANKDNNLYQKYLKEEKVVRTDEEGNAFEEKVFNEKIERYGFEYTDWRTICILRNLVQKAETYAEADIVITKKVKYEDILQYVYQNLLVYPLSITEYKIGDKLLYPECNPVTQSVNLTYIDGKDIISLKEYVKKLKVEYNLELISVVRLPDTNISYLSRFEDDTVLVLSTRPYVCTYPINVKLPE